MRYYEGYHETLQGTKSGTTRHYEVLRGTASGTTSHYQTLLDVLKDTRRGTRHYDIPWHHKNDSVIQDAMTG